MAQDYTNKPIEELLADAKSGNVQALNALGMLHELGLIPEASTAEAARLYASSAKAGDPLAALYMGVLLDNGAAGIAADPKAAAVYFQLAEKGGFRRSEKRLSEAGIGRRTILVVDDSPTLRTVTRDLLSKNGFDIVEAGDAAQAIAFLQGGGRVDLILSDVEMSNMDGVEMLAIIRGRMQRKLLPVVMLTSVRDLNVLKKAKTLGVQGWVLKPYDHDILVQIVSKALAA
jgi:two-component system chemotaxis response regulator CheY